MFHARRFIRYAIACAVVISVCTCAYLSIPAADKEGVTNASPAKVKDLLKQKLAIVKQRHEVAQREYRQGEGRLAAVLEAEASMLRVELVLSATHEERIALHEKLVSVARRHETEVALLFKAREVPNSEALKATIHRLDAEIELERSKVAHGHHEH